MCNLNTKVRMSPSEIDTIDQYRNENPKFGWVYILYDGYSKVSKIGSTKTQYLDRVNTQISGASTRICFVGAFLVNSYKDLELNTHHFFSDHRFNGEWFKVRPEIVLNRLNSVLEEEESLVFMNHLSTILKYNALVQEDLL